MPVQQQSTCEYLLFVSFWDVEEGSINYFTRLATNWPRKYSLFPFVYQQLLGGHHTRTLHLRYSVV